MSGARDLLSGSSRQLGRRGPVVLAGEHVDGAGGRVDRGEALAAVPAAEIKVEVTVEEAVGLRRVRVPDQRLAAGRSCGRLHAVDPFWVPQRLVDFWGFVVEGALHVKVGGSAGVKSVMICI